MSGFCAFNDQVSCMTFTCESHFPVSESYFDSLMTVRVRTTYSSLIISLCEAVLSLAELHRVLTSPNPNSIIKALSRAHSRHISKRRVWETSTSAQRAFFEAL